MTDTYTGQLGTTLSMLGALELAGNGIGAVVVVAVPTQVELLDTTEDELLIRQKVVTLSPAGTDGTATASALVLLARPGFLTYLQVAYTNQAATTNLEIQADSSSGQALFTATNNNSPIFSPGGVPFSTGLYVSVTDANVSTAHAKDIVVTMWITF